MKHKYLVLLPILFLFHTTSYSQENTSKVKLGFIYGFGEQGVFPFSSTDYTYEIKFYKAQINYALFERGKFNFEINIEPSYYSSEHQLLNEHFVTPNEEGYLHKRAKYTKLKSMNEYTLGLGFIVRYPIFEPLSVYALGSIGPMYIDTETERMAKGFAFSDIFSFGLSYKIKSISLDVRYGVRHVSNVNLQSPNNGYNSTNFEFGFLIDL